jgi:hypothetical protein
MQQYICIGMAEQALFIRNIHSADNQPPTLYQLMHIETLTYTHFIPPASFPRKRESSNSMIPHSGKNPFFAHYAGNYFMTGFPLSRE